MKTLVRLPTNEYAIFPFSPSLRELSQILHFQVTPLHVVRGDVIAISHLVSDLRSRGIRCFDYFK